MAGNGHQIHGAHIRLQIKALYNFEEVQLLRHT